MELAEWVKDRGLMNDGAAMLINGNLLLKFNGKTTALCLKPFESDGVVFVEGVWYSPTDETTRNRLKGAFDSGQAKVNLISGEWAVMRAMSGTGTSSPSSSLLERARGYARKMPDKLPEQPGGRSRESYRETTFEGG